MVHVRTIAQSVRHLTGGLDRFEVDAATVGELLQQLDAKHPGLERHVRDEMALVIDGAMHHDYWNEPLAADAEVVFLPRIVGG